MGTTGSRVHRSAPPASGGRSTDVPVAWRAESGGFWEVTGHAESSEVLGDPATFSSRHVTIPAIDPAVGPDLPKQSDPPEHAAHRRRLLAAMTNDCWRRVVPDVEAEADRLFAAILADGQADAVEAFAEPYAHAAFTALMGLPSDAADALWRSSGRARGPDVRASVPPPGRPAPVDRGAVTYLRRTGIFRDLYRSDRFGPPTPGGVIAALRDGAGDGAPSLDVFVGTARLLYSASVDVVAAQIGLMLWNLARLPALRDDLATDPTLAASIVDELLRIDSSLGVIREVTRPVDVGGVQMRSGDLVLVLLNSANRDPRTFDDPDVAMPGRPDGPASLVFGRGPHRCPGAAIGRDSLAIVLRRWHAGDATYELDPGAPPVFAAPPHRDLVSLPLVLRSGASGRST